MAENRGNVSSTGIRKPKSIQNKLSLVKTRFEVVSEFCDEAKNLFDSLQSIGDPITEESLVLQILNGLHIDYRMFVTNSENSDQKPSFSQLRAKLLTFESRLKQTESNYQTSIPISAMAAMNIQTLPYESSSKSVICQICDKPGHKASFCYHRFSGSGGRSGCRGGRWRSGGRNSGGRYANQQGSGGRGSGSYGNTPWQQGGYTVNMADYGGQQSVQPGSRVSQIRDNGIFFGQGSEYDSRILGSQFRPGFVHYGPQQPNRDGLFGPGPNTSHYTSSGPSPNAFQHGFNQYPLQISNGLNNFGQPNAPADSPNFGPTHFANWAGIAQTSHVGPHFGLMADLSTICDKVDSWIPDSGATAHMTTDSSLDFGAVPYTGSERVVVSAFMSIAFVNPSRSEKLKINIR
ncbi:putative transcription factor interactor and regulator CCHC(Zn) family [Helianthus annuus]|nr:putative transcription factor interactor and regulator CCHC(Zn) family [Helianthus annuus]